MKSTKGLVDDKEVSEKKKEARIQLQTLNDGAQVKGPKDPMKRATQSRVQRDEIRCSHKMMHCRCELCVVGFTSRATLAAS